MFGGSKNKKALHLNSFQLKKKKKEYWSRLPCPPPKNLFSEQSSLPGIFFPQTVAWLTLSSLQDSLYL